MWALQSNLGRPREPGPRLPVVWHSPTWDRAGSAQRSQPHPTEMRSPVKCVSSIKEKMEKMETSAGKLSALLDTYGLGDGAARGSQGIQAQRNKGNFKRHKQTSRIT